MGEIRALDRTGDTKLIWDKANSAESEAAEEMFNTLRKKNYIAYTVGKGGAKGDVITSFDPAIETIIMAPPVVGG